MEEKLRRQSGEKKKWEESDSGKELRNRGVEREGWLLCPQ